MAEESPSADAVVPAEGRLWRAPAAVADGKAPAAPCSSRRANFEDDVDSEKDGEFESAIPTAVADDEANAEQRRILGAGLKGKSPTAVAGEIDPVDQAPAVADGLMLTRSFNDDDAPGSGAHSIAGDTVDSETDGEAGGTAVAAMSRQQRLAPKAPVQGNPERNPSSKYNSEPEVGILGLFSGSWGVRCTVSSNGRRRRETQDRQILRNPAQVVVVVDASRQLEELLRLPPREHFVVRGDEVDSRSPAVLIAARKDNTTSLEVLLYEVNDDHAYMARGTPRPARSRMMVCRAGFKQNVGHLGKDVVVCGVHGHYRTMKMEWPHSWKQFWDRLARYVQHFGIQFLAGDFNMSLTEVPKQLLRRGILCDCVAWYPWQWPQSRGMQAAVMHTTEQRLGFDSCGIFYIGGSVQARTPWNLQHIDILAAVAGDHADLDVYPAANAPGQPWHCYRSRAYGERPDEKNLQDRLRDLLTPSTTQEELESIPTRGGVTYCAYLRLKQKQMDKNEWLVDGDIHNGAHFPLCVFTNNSSARSEKRSRERSDAWKRKGAKGKGKGRHKGKDDAEATYWRRRGCHGEKDTAVASSGPAMQSSSN